MTAVPYRYTVGANELTVLHSITLELTCSDAKTGKTFRGSFDKEYLSRIPVLAIDADLLSEACARVPDIVLAGTDVMSVGWTIYVGSKPKNVTFELRYELPPGVSREEQELRDLAQGLLRRVETLECKLETATDLLVACVAAATSASTDVTISLLSNACVPISDHLPEVYGIPYYEDRGVRPRDIVALKIEEALIGAIRGFEQVRAGRGWEDIIVMPGRLGIHEPLVRTHSKAGLGLRVILLKLGLSKDIEYTTGHIAILTAAQCKPGLIREFADKNVMLNLRASNGMTPREVLNLYIDKGPETPELRAMLVAARDELTSLFLDGRKLAFHSGDAKSSVRAAPSPTIHLAPPEYKNN